MTPEEVAAVFDAALEKLHGPARREQERMERERAARQAQLQAVIDAAAERMRFQARREAQHETVRRSHRVTALAGGGERECARRRRQRAALEASFTRWALNKLGWIEVPQ